MAVEPSQLQIDHLRPESAAKPQYETTFDPSPRRTLVIRHAVSGYFVAMVSVAATTLFFGLLRHWLIPQQAFLFYLPMVIMMAVRFDFGSSILAAVLSFFCWDFFFVPPYYNFTVSDPRDWLSLAVFLIAAVFTADVATRARRQTNAAEARARETDILYHASEAINREVDPERLLQTLADQIVHVCDPSRCMVFARRAESGELAVDACSPPESWPAHLDDIRKIAEAVLHDRRPIGFRESLAQWVMEVTALGFSDTTMPEEARGIYISLHVRGVDFGVLHVGRRTDSGFSPQEQRFILTLSNHAAAVMARQAAAEEAHQQARASAVAEERNRLARDVHDALSGAFNGIKFLLEAAERDGASERGRKCVTEARRLAQEGAQEARRSVWALGPAALEHAGDLASAIRTMCLSVAGHWIAADVQVKGKAAALPGDVEENLFRIAQEAVTNVVRHAHATAVTIELAFGDGCVTLRVEDNGRGMEQAAGSTGFGIKSMNQRAARLGGRLEITSAAGSGTCILLRAPATAGDEKNRRGESK